jgi:nitrate reductase delta subunit
MKRRGTGSGSERATILKLSSLALQYPDELLLKGRSDLMEAAALLHRGPAADALGAFFDWFTRTPGLELQRLYVTTFDLHKRIGLYVTYFTLGDRRERGLALLRLKNLYRAAGFEAEGPELPDYLPMMLEFAAAAAPDHGDLVLREHRPALELIRLGLAEQASPYEHVLRAVCMLVGGLTAADRLRLDRLVVEGPPHELVGLEPFAPPEVMPEGGART